MGGTSIVRSAGGARIKWDVCGNRNGGGEMAEIPDTIQGCLGLWDMNKPECSRCEFKIMCMQNSGGQDGQ